MQRVFSWSLALLVLAMGPAATAQDDSVISKYLTDSTIGGVKLDVERIDLTALKDKALGWGIIDKEKDKEMLQGLPFARAFVRGMADAGAQDAWILLDLYGIQEVPTIVLTVKPGPDQKKQVQSLLDTLSLLAPPTDEISISPKDNHILICSKLMAEQFASSGDNGDRQIPAAILKDENQVLTAFFIPSPDQKRAMNETLPAELPEPFDKVDVRSLAKEVDYASIRFGMEPEFSITSRVKTSSSNAASNAVSEIKEFAMAASQLPDIAEIFPQLSDLMAEMPIGADGDEVVVEISEKNGQVSKIINAMAAPIRAARTAAGRAQAMNNMKQIMLALHNYYDVHKGFPLRASVDENGKQLLSWRVHILPFVEQVELYNQFHLDEPWDSEHNKQLISKMPPLYLSPGTPDLGPGLTNYVVPNAEQSFMSSEEPMQFQMIRDGTSNTLAILETDPEHAVIWTKPDDLDVDFDAPKNGLQYWSGKVFLGALMDGSVQAFDKSLDDDMLKNLIQYSDGNVVDWNR